MKTADGYVLSLDPFALHIAGQFGIRWYSLAYLAGFVIGYLIACYMIQRKTTSLVSKTEVLDATTLIAVGALVGGRLGYCIFYAPHLLVEFGGSFPYWGLLKVYEGGMASHGGIAGVAFMCWLYARMKGHSFLHMMDLAVLGGSLGIFFGRIANFINGELYGRPSPEGYKWAVKFPNEIYLWTQNQVSKLLDLAPAAEALGRVQTRAGEFLDITAEVWSGWVMNYRTDTGSYNAVNLTLEALVRATEKGHVQVIEAMAPALTARYPSQLFQAVLEGLLVFVVLAVIWLKPRKPGVIAAWFGVIYAIGRILGEQFRMPDAHIGFQFLDLTRGQWLSIAMLSVALMMLTYVSRRSAQPTGGWGVLDSKK